MPNEQELEDLLLEIYNELLHGSGGLRAYLHEQDAEDAAQDACLQLLEMIRDGWVRTSLKGLAYLVIRRRVCREFAWQQRQQRLKDNYSSQTIHTQDGPVDPAKAAEREEEGNRLWEAIQQLGELERLTIGLRYFGGYTYRAIAEELGFDDEDAVNTCLRRARRQLRCRLQEEHAQRVRIA